MGLFLREDILQTILPRLMVSIESSDSTRVKATSEQAKVSLSRSGMEFRNAVTGWRRPAIRRGDVDGLRKLIKKARTGFAAISGKFNPEKEPGSRIRLETSHTDGMQ